MTCCIEVSLYCKTVGLLENSYRKRALVYSDHCDESSPRSIETLRRNILIRVPILMVDSFPRRSTYMCYILFRTFRLFGVILWRFSGIDLLVLHIWPTAESCALPVLARKSCLNWHCRFTLLAFFEKNDGWKIVTKWIIDNPPICSHLICFTFLHLIIGYPFQ